MKLIKRLSKEKYPIKFLVSRLLWKTGLCRLFKIQRNGYQLRFFPSSSSATHWLDPDWILDDEQFFEAYLEKGDFVVDIGANIGALTMKAASIVGSGGHVVSFEGHPRIATYIAGNVKLNAFDNVELHQCALGEKEGTATFSNRHSDDQNCIADCGLQVTMKTLDSCLSSAEKIDLLKIDVEGYENMVFQGANKTLRQCECIYFESAKRHCDKFDYKQGEIIQLLIDYGFQVYKLDGSRLYGVDGQYESDVLENLIAIRDLDNFLKKTNYSVES